nr:hypothetical protein CFP56_36695 [Quercus suber]
MAEPGQQPAESRASQHVDSFLNLEQRQDCEGSVHTMHVDRSQSHGGSHMSHAEKNQNMQLEIDRLKRELRHAKRKQFLCILMTNRTSLTSRDIEHQSVNPLPMKKSTIMSANLEVHHVAALWNVSHFNQRMVVYSKDETLMCKVFPSSLGPVVMRWFNSLKADSISSFKELTQAFVSRFVTCQRVARPLASLLSLSMQEGETLKTYSDRYWEMFNEMEGNFDGMALSTFKLGLPTDHGLRKSLTGNPVTNML